LPAIKQPYELTPESAELLSAAAKEDCYICKGTGLGGWKSHGHVPEVCRCARDAWRENAIEVGRMLAKASQEGPRNDKGAVLVKPPQKQPMPTTAQPPGQDENKTPPILG
jgi:hypothetical protein